MVSNGKSASGRPADRQIKRAKNGPCGQHYDLCKNGYRLGVAAYRSYHASHFFLIEKLCIHRVNTLAVNF